MHLRFAFRADFTYKDSNFLRDTISDVSFNIPEDNNKEKGLYNELNENNKKNVPTNYTNIVTHSEKDG